MKIATITEAKNRLSALIDRVRGGETVIIVDRGIPVARLEPAAGGGEDAGGRLARLERLGILRRGAGHPPVELLRLRGMPPRPRSDVSAVQALVNERREGR